MGETFSTRMEFEAVWRERVIDALHQLNYARLHLQEVQHTLSVIARHSQDDHEFRQALRAVTEARQDFTRAEIVFRDLFIKGELFSEGITKEMVKYA